MSPDEHIHLTALAVFQEAIDALETGYKTVPVDDRLRNQLRSQRNWLAHWLARWQGDPESYVKLEPDEFEATEEEEEEAQKEEHKAELPGDRWYKGKNHWGETLVFEVARRLSHYGSDQYVSWTVWRPGFTDALLSAEHRADDDTTDLEAIREAMDERDHDTTHRDASVEELEEISPDEAARILASGLPGVAAARMVADLVDRVSFWDPAFDYLDAQREMIAHEFPEAGIQLHHGSDWYEEQIGRLRWPVLHLDRDAWRERRELAPSFEWILTLEEFVEEELKAPGTEDWPARYELAGEDLHGVPLAVVIIGPDPEPRPEAKFPEAAFYFVMPEVAAALLAHRGLIAAPDSDSEAPDS